MCTKTPPLCGSALHPPRLFGMRLSPVKQLVADLFTDFEEDTEPHLTVMYLGSVPGDVVTLAVDECRRSVERLKTVGMCLNLKQHQSG